MGQGLCSNDFLLEFKLIILDVGKHNKDQRLTRLSRHCAEQIQLYVLHLTRFRDIKQDIYIYHAGHTVSSVITVQLINCYCSQMFAFY